MRSNARSMNRCNSESHLISKGGGADCIDLELDGDVRQSFVVARATKAVLYYLSQRKVAARCTPYWVAQTNPQP